MRRRKKSILTNQTTTQSTQGFAALGITGNHIVALRAYDAAGNAVTKEIEGK